MCSCCTGRQFGYFTGDHLACLDHIVSSPLGCGPLLLTSAALLPMSQPAALRHHSCAGPAAGCPAAGELLLMGQALRRNATTSHHYCASMAHQEICVQKQLGEPAKLTSTAGATLSNGATIALVTISMEAQAMHYSALGTDLACRRRRGPMHRTGASCTPPHRSPDICRRAENLQGF